MFLRPLLPDKAESDGAESDDTPHAVLPRQTLHVVFPQQTPPVVFLWQAERSTGCATRASEVAGATDTPRCCFSRQNEASCHFSVMDLKHLTHSIFQRHFRTLQTEVSR
jgi:hypothetical protein